MPNPATARAQRLRKTKAQLIDEIETLERRAAPIGAKAGDRYLADRELADLARFPSENPNPVLRVLPDGAVLYANEAARAVTGLLKGRKKSALAPSIANDIAQVSRTTEVREAEFESDDRIFAFSIAAVAGETYINIYGREITREHAAKRELAEKEAQFRIALDSMPGLLVYTDEDFNVVLCNQRFSEMYQAQSEMLQPGQPYPVFLRCLAEQGYYGEGDVETLVAERVESLRNPSDKTFQETTPVGRVHRVRRQRALAGGTVTVVTDITDQKRAEKALAEKETQLRLALDNMPGGMMLGDRDLNNMFFNAQYSELCGFPDGLVKVGGSFRDELRYQAERGDFGPGDTDDLIEEVAAIYRRGEAVSFERTIAGSERTVQIYLGPTPEGGYVTILTDITERKRAEAELAEMEAQLRIALDNMPGGIEFVDRNSNYVFFNPQYIELHDFPVGLLKIGGSVFDETRFQAERGDFGPGDPDHLMEEAHVPFRSGEPESYDRTLPGGRTLHFNVAPTPEGGYVTIATDISERKRAEEELAEKEAQIRVALTHMPGGMKLIDGDRKYVLFNPQYSELHDYPDGLLKEGGSIVDEARFQAERGDYGHGDPEELIEESLVPYESSEPESYERTLPGGRTLQFYSAPTPEGGFVSIVTDVTERKQAEQELARKEAQLRVALDNMPGGMMMWDRDLNYVLFNAQYSELYEFPDGLVKVGESIRDELRYQADRGDFGPGNKDELVEQVLAVYPRGETVSYERAIAGTGRTLQIHLAPTPGGGNAEIVTDITERKRAEQAAAEAKRRAEETSKLVAQKNQMLESLSSQLSKYLSPQVYASIFSGEQSVEIASKRKKLTIFFSDIADFAGTTDSLESEELTNLLNRYLTEMSKIALDFGATIDKYVGDSIVAFFGDPETKGVKEDAKSCVNMAIAMQRRMRELRSEWLDMGLEQPFEVRIGINTGFCTVGNFGSADRMDYTIIGNEVNLAARLEARAEVGGILMAHETHALVKDTVLAEEGDTLTVKGFAKPVRTYSVAGLYDDLAAQGRIIRKEQDGVRVLVDLEKGDKAAAIQAIEDVLSQLKG